MEEVYLDACPGCDKMVDCTLLTCPYCKYDFMNMKPAKQPKEKKKKKPEEKLPTVVSSFQMNKEKQKHKEEEREREIEVKKVVRGSKPSGSSCIVVPALGRMGQKPIDFPELHWPRGLEPTDENLLNWALAVREAYPIATKDKMSWLANHAVGYLATNADGPGDAVLNENASRIVNLLGGDDW